MSDCQSCVKACKGTFKTETNAKKTHARIYSMLLQMLKGVPHSNLTWMPTYTAAKQVGVRRKGDGQLLTAIDRVTSELADKHAKIAVAEHRVPEATRTHHEQQAKVIEEVAKWIGQAIFSANNQPSHPKRDTVAARPRKKKNEPRGKGTERIELRPVGRGGHTVRKFGQVFKCVIL